MYNPPHPGEVVKHECLEPLGLTVTRAAEGLGVARQTLSALINERSRVSPEMAVCLTMAFGSTPETWLGLQTAYDLWQLRDYLEAGEVEDFSITRKYTSKEHEERQIPTEEESARYWAGVDAAMRRAAIKARKRAIETTGSVPTWRDGKLVYDTEV